MGQSSLEIEGGSCAGRQSPIQFVSSTILKNEELAEFRSTQLTSIDKATVFEDLQKKLTGARYWLSRGKVTQTCSKNKQGLKDWFKSDEMFIFIDESENVKVDAISNILNGKPVYTTLTLIGNVRHFLVIAKESTCIYRSGSDVQNRKDNIARASDTPSPTPRPSPSTSVLPTPSMKPTPSALARPSPTPSIQPSPLPSKTVESSPQVSPSTHPSSQPSPTPSVKPSPTASESSSSSPGPFSSATPSGQPLGSTNSSEGTSKPANQSTKPSPSSSPVQIPPIVTTRPPTLSAPVTGTASKDFQTSTNTVTSTQDARTTTASGQTTIIVTTTVGTTSNKDRDNIQSTTSLPGITTVEDSDEDAAGANSQGQTAGAISQGQSNASTDDVEGFSACFPAYATATLFDGTTKNMTELGAGDLVMTGSGGQSSAIFMFTHADPAREYEFLELKESSGRTLTLSPGHILYSNDMEPTPANDVRRGDTLYMLASNGMKATTVATVRRVRATGLYNPQTLHGDILVDGFLTTTYTTALQPQYAHQLLAPLRTLYRVGISTSLFDLTYGGEQWAKWQKSVAGVFQREA